MNRLERLATWHQVSSARFLGPVRFKRLWQLYGDDIGSVFRMSDDELLAIKDVFNRQSIAGIRQQARNYQLSYDFMEGQLERAQACGGNIIAFGDSMYPDVLAHSRFCHALLYCVGDWACIEHSDRIAAIVGTRCPARQSLLFARRISRELAGRGWIVASGMAKGIDTEAHRGALEAGGRTIAVLGCGPDVVYPRESVQLYREIIERGLILSEYPFGEHVDELKLKRRNKMIVALSRGVVLVESDVDGGAMNAVAACREQKKPLMTILPEWPGRFTGNRKVDGEEAFTIPIDQDSSARIASLLESPLPGLAPHL